MEVLWLNHYNDVALSSTLAWYRAPSSDVHEIDILKMSRARLHCSGLGGSYHQVLFCTRQGQVRCAGFMYFTTQYIYYHQAHISQTNIYFTTIQHLYHTSAHISPPSVCISPPRTYITRKFSPPMADFLKAVFLAQTKCPAKKYLRMKMCRKGHNTQKVLQNQ